MKYPQKIIINNKVEYKYRCPICKIIFYSKSKKSVYCSRKCYNKTIGNAIKNVRKNESIEKKKLRNMKMVKTRRKRNNYFPNQKTRIKMSISAKNKPPVKKETIRKMALANIGKKRSKATKLLLSRQKMGDKNPMRIKYNSPENNLKKFVIMVDKVSKTKGYKTGFYNGVRYRSSYELETMKYFDKNKIEWEYEKYKFYLECLGKTYIPDFYLPKEDIFIETKGRMTNDSFDKIEYFMFEFPEKKIEVWNEKILKEKNILR